jgi:hypothetical protein
VKEYCLFAEEGGNPGDSISVVTPNTAVAESLRETAKSKLFCMQNILRAE